MGEKRDAYCVSVGKPGEKNCLEDLGEDGRIILKESSRSRVVEREDRWWALPKAVIKKKLMKLAKFLD